MSELRRGLAGPSDFLFWCLWVLAGGLLRVYFRLSVVNPPRLAGAYVLAANHGSLLDGVVLQAAVPRRVSYLLTVAFYRLRWLRWFFRWIRAIPIHDAGGNKNALQEATRRLREGGVVGIFPEGGVSRSGALARAKPGVAILAEGAQSPVVPARIVGAFEAMPRGSWFPKPRKITIRFGAPLPPPARADSPRRLDYRDYAERVMQAIASL